MCFKMRGKLRLCANVRVHVCWSLSRVQPCATARTVSCWLPLSVGFSRQEFPTPGDLPDPGMEPWPPALQTDASTPEPPFILTFCFILENV